MSGRTTSSFDAGVAWQQSTRPVCTVGAIGVGRWCEYALVDDETLAVEFRRIPFDLDELFAAALANDFPYFDRWVDSWKA